MDSYEDIIFRVSQNLSDIEKEISKPIDDVGNLYRKTAESICKAVIVGKSSDAGGNLDKLISKSSIILRGYEQDKDVKIYTANAKFLQGLGNALSHDSSSSGNSLMEGQDRLFHALLHMVKLAFYSNGDLYPLPSLPKIFRDRIPTRLISRYRVENLHAEEVVQLCFPKSKVEVKLSEKNNDTRVIFDYVTCQVDSGVETGYLFLGSRASIEKSIIQLKRTYFDANPAISLTIITPRIYRSNGKEVDRRKSILDICEKESVGLKKFRYSAYYFDDFVWGKCLPHGFSNEVNIDVDEYFIDQGIEKDCGEDGGSPNSFGRQRITEFLDMVIGGSHESSPVQVVTGPAGIGKTTFCDDIVTKVGGRDKKKAVLISATDFRDLQNYEPVSSVKDLYSLAKREGAISSEDSLESENFEINLICGNLILVIDGFDELESHLGGALNSHEFIKSLSRLDEDFNKVLVIITVRDHDLQRFREYEGVSVFRLSGFSEDDVTSYFNKRLRNSDINQAKRMLREFSGDGENNKVVPLYASLVCDYLLEEDGKGAVEKGSEYLIIGNPLDLLVSKIIEREMAKQSLGIVSVDDFFELLVEIVKRGNEAVSREQIKGYLDCVVDHPGEKAQENFARNAFVSTTRTGASDKDYWIRFKYDSLSNFFKSRYLLRWIKKGVFDQGMAGFVSECYQGEGALYDEIRKVSSCSDFSTSEAKNWFSGLLGKSEDQFFLEPIFRRAVSGFLYLLIDPVNLDSRNERKSLLSDFFQGYVWENFSIYGRFVPLDLSGIEIVNGYLQDFESLVNSTYLSEKPVFFDSVIRFEDGLLPNKIDSFLFDSSCTLSENMRSAFKEKEMSDENNYELIKENIYKLVKVGFRANSFSWKSESMYRKVTVLGKSNRDDYLAFLERSGVLIKDPSKASKEGGFLVSKPWQKDLRKLIEDKNATGQVVELLEDAVAKLQ